MNAAGGAGGLQRGRGSPSSGDRARAIEDPRGPEHYAPRDGSRRRRRDDSGGSLSFGPLRVAGEPRYPAAHLNPAGEDFCAEGHSRNRSQNSEKTRGRSFRACRSEEAKETVRKIPKRETIPRRDRAIPSEPGNGTLCAGPADRETSRKTRGLFYIDFSRRCAPVTTNVRVPGEER